MERAKGRVECGECGGCGYTYERVHDYEDKDKDNYEREWCTACGGNGTNPKPDWLDKLLGRYT